MSVFDYFRRSYPGPGVGNFAAIPTMENPLFSPIGPGVAYTYPWRLTSPGWDLKKTVVIAGAIQGVPTGDFIAGTRLVDKEYVSQFTGP